jgi:hypothetical protein
VVSDGAALLSGLNYVLMKRYSAIGIKLSLTTNARRQEYPFTAARRKMPNKGFFNAGITPLG